MLTRRGFAEFCVLCALCDHRVHRDRSVGGERRTARSDTGPYAKDFVANGWSRCPRDRIFCAIVKGIAKSYDQ